MEITSETVKGVPIEELAKIRQGLSSDHPEAILIDNEIDRRNRLHQHELNSDLISRTDRRARRAEIIAIIAATIAALSMIKDIIIAGIQVNLHLTLGLRPILRTAQPFVGLRRVPFRCERGLTECIYISIFRYAVHLGPA